MKDARAFLTANVSRETLLALETYVELLTKWNQRINLVSRKSIPDVWERHIIDSYQIALLAPEPTSSWVDLGSGGGLPGLVVSILNPGLPVTLVESDQRKCIFLNTVVQTLNLSVRIENRRIETDFDKYDVVSARALASLEDLLVLANPYRAPGTTCLFMKGAAYRDELSKAAQTWRIEYDAIPSLTQPDSAVIRVKEYSRV